MYGMLTNGEHMLRLWLFLFVAAGIVGGVVSGFLKARKIQPNGFKWKIFRHEVLVATITIAISGTIIGQGTAWLKGHGWIAFHSDPAVWWQIALEYLLYFFLFDTY